MKTLSFSTLLTAILLAILVLPLQAQKSDIQYFRSYDKEGIGIFETNKQHTPFTGQKIRIGANFTQQFQALESENQVVYDSENAPMNLITRTKPGFNLATANLNIDAQLEDGIRLNVVTYLSSRHHSEAWVKGGYIQFDRLAFLNSEFLDKVMEKVTIKVGHMEINYGDGHFRRTDNGNAIQNAFVGNYILDAFNTEIGAEIYYQDKGFLAMVGATGGEIGGNVSELPTRPTDANNRRSPAYIGKLGYNLINDNTHFRVSGSGYYTASSAANHLFDGDRAGSRYYSVMTIPGARAGDSGWFTSGRYNPDFSDAVTALQGNIFFKSRGLEIFGLLETARGRDHLESDKRNVSQLAVEALYRFGAKENIYLGSRYNTITADDPSGNEIGINRIQFGAGWYLTKNILIKGEYVTQNYKDFPTESIYNDGKFKGFVFEAVVGF
jgi:hypothetical protein